MSTRKPTAPQAAVLTAALNRTLRRRDYPRLYTPFRTDGVPVRSTVVDACSNAGWLLCEDAFVREPYLVLSAEGSAALARVAS